GRIRARVVRSRGDCKGGGDDWRRAQNARRVRPRRPRGTNRYLKHARNHVRGSRRNETFFPCANDLDWSFTGISSGIYPARTSLPTNSQSKSKRLDSNVRPWTQSRLNTLNIVNGSCRRVPYTRLKRPVKNRCPRFMTWLTIT